MNLQPECKEALRRVDERIQGLPITSLLVRLDVPRTSEWEWFNKVQRTQDTGYTWGEAVKA